jgi:hypothetical protein
MRGCKPPFRGIEREREKRKVRLTRRNLKGTKLRRREKEEEEKNWQEHP